MVYDGYLVHHLRLAFCLLVRHLMLAHSQPSVVHHQVILAIRQRQFARQRNVKTALAMRSRQALL